MCNHSARRARPSELSQAKVEGKITVANAIPQQFNYTITHTSYHIIQLKKFKINHFLYNKKYNVCTSDELKLYLKLSDVMLLHWYMVHSFGLAFGAPPFYCLLFEIESLWLSACSVEYIERLK